MDSVNTFFLLGRSDCVGPTATDVHTLYRQCTCVHIRALASIPIPRQLREKKPKRLDFVAEKQPNSFQLPNLALENCTALFFFYERFMQHNMHGDIK